MSRINGFFPITTSLNDPILKSARSFSIVRRNTMSLNDVILQGPLSQQLVGCADKIPQGSSGRDWRHQINVSSVLSGNRIAEFFAFSGGQRETRIKSRKCMQ